MADFVFPPNCTQQDLDTFSTLLKTASNGCVGLLSYDWISLKTPTVTQFADICKCVPSLNWFRIPDCSIQKGLDKAELDGAFNWIVRTQCDYYATAPICTVDEVTALTRSLNTASNGCIGAVGYDWGSDKYVNDTQFAEICKCSPSMKSFELPYCNVIKGPGLQNMMSYVDNAVNKNCNLTTPVNYTRASSASDKSTADKTTADKSVTIPPTGSSGGASSSSSTGLIFGIAGGVVVVALIIGFIVYKRRRKSSGEPCPIQNNTLPSPVVDYRPIAATPTFSKTNATGGGCDPSYSTISTASSSMHPSGTDSNGSRRTQSKGSDGKWDDPVIVAARIPRNMIFFGPLISRGGFGEVFRGTYMGEAVAIKQLLPARRKDLKQIDDFLGEVKLMSSLDHERIVRFIGVAWNSLSDACMVVEYMENGDLRSVLTRWNEGVEQRSTGFDADKIKIALHIAHALTYLHSMQPIVVHRDLKSKNILLDANLDAKLTDFGISRERAESTMTAGVGSSLWMAPEVMMGERYDEKADVFSFGVVLSELDTHQLPYFQAKDIPETAVLQQVMLGRLSVSFSDRADQDLAQLGRDCVNLDRKDRPSAAQVLHRVHQVLQRL